MKHLPETCLRSCDRPLNFVDDDPDYNNHNLLYDLVLLSCGTTRCWPNIKPTSGQVCVPLNTICQGYADWPNFKTI